MISPVRVASVVLVLGALAVGLPLLRSREVAPIAVDVAPGARPAALALADSLFYYHGARVARLAVIGDALLVKLAPGQFSPAVRFIVSGSGCLSQPYPTPAMRALARRAWTAFGRAQGAHRVHVAVGSANEVARWTPAGSSACGSVEGLAWVTFDQLELESPGP